MSIAPSFIFLLALPLLAAPGSRVLVAERLLLSGQTAEAAIEFRAALAGSAGAERAAILDGLGRAESQAGRFREAQRHFAASTAMTEAGSRPWAIALSNAGRVHLELKELARAEEAFRQALEVLGGEARLWQSLGQAQYLRERHHEAEESFRRALALADRSLAPVVASDLALLLEQRRQFAKAADVLREAIAVSGAGQGRARTRTNLAMLLVKMNRKAEGVSEMRAALAEMEAAVGPQHPDVATILGRYTEVLRKAGHKEAAVAAGKRAEEIRSAFAAQGGDRRTSVDWRDLR